MADAEELAREALGDQAADLRVESLAGIGYDCPFLIVVGAHLVRTAKLSDADLVSQALLRREILTRFADIVAGGAGAGATRPVLEAVAAVQPVPLNEPEFMDCIARLSEQDHDHVLDVLDELEDLGLVLRRQKTVRVVPDLLGEAILERALVSNSGIAKQFANSIARHAAGRALTHAIRNVSTIDWHRRSEGPSQLAGVLWSAFSSHALGLSNSGRIELGKRVAPVAAIHPGEALDMVDRLLSNPAPNEDDPISGILGEPRQITSEDLARSLAPLIANAGHNEGHLDRAVRLLLRIGISDHRDENQNPYHALRLMRELGEFRPRRPVAFNERYVEVIGILLRDDSLKTERFVLVSMLKAAVARDFTVTEAKGFSVVLSHGLINAEAVATVRSLAIELATECLAGDDKTALAAIDVLKDALQSDDRKGPVTEEFARVADTLRRIIANPERSARLRLAAYRALGWHAAYGNGERRQLARSVRRQLVRDDDSVLVRALGSGWHTDEDEDEDEEDGSSAVSRYERSVRAMLEDQENVVDRWVTRGEENALLDRVRTAMNEELAMTGRFSPPNELLRFLFTAAPKVAREFLREPRVLDTVEAAITQAALATLLDTGDAGAEVAGESLIAAGAAAARVVALAVVDTRTGFNETCARLARKLIATTFPEVHLALLWTAPRIWPTDRGLVLEILRGAAIEFDPSVADAAAEVLASGHPPIWTTVSPQERKDFLARFSATPKLSPHGIGALLNEEIKTSPLGTLAFLQRRVEGRERSPERFDPLPDIDSMGLDFRSSTKLPELIEATVEWILEDRSWERQFYGTRILRRMVDGFQEDAQSLIGRLIRTREKPQIELARSLLYEAPRDFVIREQEFVVELVEDAYLMPESLREHVIAGLHGSAEYGMRSRSVGVDDPVEVALRDEAKAISALYAEGSPIHRFYEEASLRASRRLDSERADDRSLTDPRAW
jgi:hypothetical protein